ncbi:MAG: peptidylprolyl isomerase [Oligoflexia bacterium]|nr:peptidylprolyl isomerase [Oligoflexia bacterium]
MLKLACLMVFALNFVSITHAAEIVATINGRAITVEEFNRRYAEVKKSVPLNPPTKKAFLEDLVRFEMGVQEAERRKLDQTPIVAERIRQQLYVGLIETELKAKIDAIQITESEMRDYYKSNPELRTSHILIEVKQGASEQERAAAKKRADEIYAEVRKSSRPFEELVKLYTDDIVTKRNGGDVGFQSRITLIPGFSLAPSYYDTALKLRIGEISGVVETPYGFHIIKLTGRNSFEDANKRAINAAILEKKKVGLFNQYFEKLRRSYKIATNPELLK